MPPDATSDVGAERSQIRGLRTSDDTLLDDLNRDGDIQSVADRIARFLSTLFFERARATTSGKHLVRTFVDRRIWYWSIRASRISGQNNYRLPAIIRPRERRRILSPEHGVVVGLGRYELPEFSDIVRLVEARVQLPHHVERIRGASAEQHWLRHYLIARPVSVRQSFGRGTGFSCEGRRMLEMIERSLFDQPMPFPRKQDLQPLSPDDFFVFDGKGATDSAATDWENLLASGGEWLYRGFWVLSTSSDVHVSTYLDVVLGYSGLSPTLGQQRSISFASFISELHA